MRSAISGLVSIILIAACENPITSDGPLPKPGTIEVTAATMGPDADGDGYVVTLNGGTSHPLLPNGSVTFTGVTPGNHEVRLDAVRENCSVEGGTDRRVNVDAGRLANTTFQVTCHERVGSLAVHVATEGGELPADGYRIEVDGAVRQRIGLNDTVTLDGLHEGPHSVRVLDVADPCGVEPNSRQVTVAFGQTTSAAFDVACGYRRSEPFVEVSAGDRHTCARTRDGSLWCWGWNYWGQLGDGTAVHRLIATPVQSGESFVQVSAGAGYTCARAAAGPVYCWGDNGFGQLGDGGTEASRPVPGLVRGIADVVEVSTGRDEGYAPNQCEYTGCGHTCARTADGPGYCWGGNESGQLGDGTRTGRLMPTAVAGDRRFAEISAGGGHTCGVTDTGSAYCWGTNYEGQLGSPTAASGATVPTPVNVNETFTDVKASAYHTCGLTTSGAIYCWGINSSGQLGNGTRSPPGYPPVVLPPAPVVGNLRFIAVTVGWHHSCGLGSDGTAYCWGHDALGEVGPGLPTEHLVPTPVSGNLKFVEISAGLFHTCARTADGNIYCWGEAAGAIGDGTLSPRRVPTRVR